MRYTGLIIASRRVLFFIIEGDVIFDLGKYKRFTNFTEPDGVHSTKHRNSDEVYNRFEMYALFGTGT